MGVSRGNPVDRFWGFVRKGEPDECWIWIGSKGGKGYGEFCVHDTYEQGRLKVGAHVFALWLIGQNTEGAEAHHLCETRACVNPDHLRVISRGEHACLHQQIWTRETVVQKIQEFADKYGMPPSALDWNVAAARNAGYFDRVERYEQGHWPSVASVQKVFGSWSEGLAAAGFASAKGKWRRNHIPVVSNAG